MVLAAITIILLLVAIGVVSYFLWKKTQEAKDAQAKIAVQLATSIENVDGILNYYAGNNAIAVKNLRNIRNAILNLTVKDIPALCMIAQSMLPDLKQKLTDPKINTVICIPDTWTTMLSGIFKSFYTHNECVDNPIVESPDPNVVQPTVTCNPVVDTSSPIYTLQTQIASDINSLILQLTKRICPNGTYSSAEAIKIIDNIYKLICTDKIQDGVLQKTIDPLLGGLFSTFIKAPVS
jgi:hypothetical protein